MQQSIPRIIEFAVEYQNRYWEIILEHDSVQLPSSLSVTYSPAGCPDLKGTIRIESRLHPDKNYRWYQSLLLTEEIALQKDFLDKIGNAIEQKIFERSRPSTTTYINRSENSNYNASQDRLSIPFYAAGHS